MESNIGMPESFFVTVVTIFALLPPRRFQYSEIASWLVTHPHQLPPSFADGMIDCSDSECCSHPICAEHIMCLASNDPVEVLLRKQPPSVTASFYQRVKFLIEENSVQSYAHLDEYSERLVTLSVSHATLSLLLPTTYHCNHLIRRQPLRGTERLSAVV